MKRKSVEKFEITIAHEKMMKTFEQEYSRQRVINLVIVVNILETWRLGTGVVEPVVNLLLANFIIDLREGNSRARII